jgi:hypothetical protein
MKIFIKPLILLVFSFMLAFSSKAQETQLMQDGLLNLSIFEAAINNNQEIDKDHAKKLHSTLLLNYQQVKNDRNLESKATNNGWMEKAEAILEKLKMSF